MNPCLKKELKKQLEAQSTNPQKRLGQNFLIDKGVISEILEAADIKNSDTVLEVGPGTGNLTRGLAKMAKKVIAVEKDEEMHEILSKLKESEKIENVEIVRKDIRNIGNWLSKIGDYKVVANIPFYLTAYLIRSFLEAKNQPKEMLLVIQKEVAQRICVNPPDMNLLSVSVQFYAKPKIINYIPKESFWPTPKVDGAIIKISDIKKPKAGAELFFRIAKAGFCQPRKQILNNLANGLRTDRDPVKQWLAENGIKPEQRAETLSVEQWINLSKSLKIT
jgi:16S rRNA (adenine1518-N6/adenine1519-N6)-dimethyltransferase